MIMVTSPSFGSPSFRFVAKGLIALHELIKEGKDDSPEANSIRDALDGPLCALNRAEKERAQWLSEDLYSVSEQSAVDVHQIVDIQTHGQLNQALSEAFDAQKRSDWDQALALLRQWKAYIVPSLLSYLRGSIWLASGNLDVATVFYRHSSESDPENATYKERYMFALAGSDPSAARILAKEILDAAEKYAPAVVARAVAIRLNEGKVTPDVESTKLCRALIPILEKNIERIQELKGTPGLEIAYAMSTVYQGVCYEVLGNVRAAIDCYSTGLEVNPENHLLLVARGILQYGASPRAIIDLERAVELGSSAIWPYLFLAHYYLSTKRFESCRTMCEAGLKMHGSDTARSQLEEWRAIAQAELGFSPELVRAAFEAAIRLDSSNDLAKRNRAAFEASLKSPHTPLHLNWLQRTEATIRQFGLAERRYSSAA